jgi:hypothetical protein
MPLLAQGEGTEEGSLLDQIWPKKEGLTLIKWCVPKPSPRPDSRCCLGWLERAPLSPEELL